MAVGMVSSAQGQQAQQAQQPKVLRAGESVASSQQALKDPNAKTYFHTCDGARFIMPDGLEIHFLGCRFTTNDERIIYELDQVANKSTSQIYTQQETAVALKEQKAAVAKEAADTAGTAGTGSE